ncbi:MAG: hypothetical protein OXG97_03860 [Candidatus Poribacteria bacterium]|nr:hypothetical protein [Candidatus Poribacteria bacterium]
MDAMDTIEFYDVPEEHEILLEFKNGVKKTCRCRTDISHDNIVEAVYDRDDNVIATSARELRELGVRRATVKAFHDVNLNDKGYY